MELFNFRTRVDFVPELVFVEDEEDEAVAQFKGRPPGGTAAPGREG